MLMRFSFKIEQNYNFGKRKEEILTFDTWCSRRMSWISWVKCRNVEIDDLQSWELEKFPK